MRKMAPGQDYLVCEEALPEVPRRLRLKPQEAMPRRCPRSLSRQRWSSSVNSVPSVTLPLASPGIRLFMILLLVLLVARTTHHCAIESIALPGLTLCKSSDTAGGGGGRGSSSAAAAADTEAEVEAEVTLAAAIAVAVAE